MSFKRIGIVRTDSIGDVVLTLPMAGAIKQKYPSCQVVFIGRNYTVPIIRCCAHVDEVCNWDEVAVKEPEERSQWMEQLALDVIVFALPDIEVMRVSKQAKVPTRIATAKRSQSWKYANKRVWFTRKKSNLHEAVLNFKLLAPLEIGIPTESEVSDLYGFDNLPPLPSTWSRKEGKRRIIIHPKSQGSAVEWGSGNFSALIHLLNSDTNEIVVTGTEKEYDLVKGQLPFDQPNVVNAMAQMSLDDLVAFINSADLLIAASTGPLHIASALGIHAVGLYTPQRPMHPGRWKPIGENAHFFVAKEHPSVGQFLAIKANDVLNHVNLVVPIESMNKRDK